MSDPQKNKPTGNIDIKKTRDSIVIVGSDVQGDIINQSSQRKMTLKPFNMELLAKELLALRVELSKLAETAAQYEALAKVALAAEAAKHGDEKAIITALKSAGEWALKVAEKFALPLATSALKSSLGIA